MFRWNMSLATGIETIDHGRHQLLEAMADFFLILDDPALSQKLVAERTGAIFSAMKASFAAEDEFLKKRPEEEVAKHLADHAAFQQSYVDLCKKFVPKIKNVKQAQQSCLEIYRNIDTGVYPHLNGEAMAYKHMLRHPAKSDDVPKSSSASA
jgi:hemerythrin